MKYLLLLLLVGCEIQSDNYMKKESERIRTELNRVQDEVKTFCSCHGGLDIFVYGDGILTFECNDKSRVKMIGDLGSIKILGCLK